jgi:hypothetical protein
MSRYTLADRLIGYRSAIPLAYNGSVLNPQLTNCTECHQARAPELLDEHGVYSLRMPVILMPPHPCTLDAWMGLRPGWWGDEPP